MAWRLLKLVLLIEAIGGVVVLYFAVEGALADSAEPLGQRLSIVVAAAIAWIWVCVTLGGALRLRAGWVRGSAVTMHVLLFAAGTGVLQFQLASTLTGWVLILLAFAGFFTAVLAQPLLSEADIAAMEADD